MKSFKMNHSRLLLIVSIIAVIGLPTGGFAIQSNTRFHNPFFDDYFSFSRSPFFKLDIPLFTQVDIESHEVSEPTPPQPDKGSKIPKILPSLKSLDLTRPPTNEELMAAGQLGGQLYPTHEIDDKE